MDDYDAGDRLPTAYTASVAATAPLAAASGATKGLRMVPCEMGPAAAGGGGGGGGGGDDCGQATVGG